MEVQCPGCSKTLVVPRPGQPKPVSWSTRPPARAATQSVATQKCPFCAEEILATAIKCKHCGSTLTGNAGARASVPASRPYPPQAPAGSQQYTAPAKAEVGRGFLIGAYVAACLMPLIGFGMAVYLFVKGKAGHGFAVAGLSLFMVFFWIGFWPAFTEALNQ